jgi:prolycopene isomerase
MSNKLKAILSLPLLGNAGLPSKRISAIIGVLIYKEFMLDGGYYPDGSIQSFPDTLAERFKELGGEIYLSCPVKKIVLNNKKAEGVETVKKGTLSSKYVVSNADAMMTYRTLLGEEELDGKILDLLDNMEPSLSAFVLYLGTDGKLKNRYADSTVWYLPHYDMDKLYGLTMEGKVDDLDWFLTKVSPDKNSIFMFVNVPFISEQYWQENKLRLIDTYMNKMERVLPGVSSHVIFKDAATPKTMNKWTSNYKGAAYGWARTASQFAVTGFTQTTSIKNLYLTGHWTTLFQGVAGVAYLGRDTSMKILKRESK